MKKCELCKKVARMYCNSDEASLCWDCDSRVHTANFLVAKHTRTLLCHACQSPTSWTGSGPKLGPTVSVCDDCVRGDHRDPEDEDDDSEDDDDDENGDFNNDDDDDHDDDGDDDDDDGENQVVPLSPPPSFASTSTSNTEESSSRFSYHNEEKNGKHKKSWTWR
ncbi:B-box zinc finger protein 32 [Phtheirospermum japonicum]|uniref:B-box zinc finger protein 32 n=1 Tax=Phtheirospermum japonicum TaxID=374723 RepID=A0A830BA47_9LAMI|nr:B-box zinc finger protein 32 [Phtheirospermum japonicum]